MLLTADASVGNYWITVQPQYRLGSPNGFGILQYEGAPPSLPQTATPQPGATKPWSLPQIAQVSTTAWLFVLIQCWQLWCIVLIIAHVAATASGIHMLY